MRQPVALVLSVLFWLCTLQTSIAGINHRNDVWQLDLSSNTWTQLFPSNGPPAPRRFFAHAYDSARNRLILVGGEGDDLVLYSDAWALGLNNPGAESWTYLGSAHGAFGFRPGLYDSLRDRFVVVHANGHLDVLNLSNPYSSWSQIWTGGLAEPLQITTHSGVYDTLNDRYLVFGGGSGASATNRVRVLSPATSSWWYDLALGPAYPTPRGLTGAVYDPFMQRLIFFGGAPLGGFGVGGISVNDTWELSLAAGWEAWNQLSPSPVPLDRAQNAVAFDTTRRRMLFFGGLQYFSQTNCSDLPSFVALNDTWALSSDGSTWTQLDPGGEGARPDYRRGAGVVYDQQHDRLILFGGQYFMPPSTSVPAAPSDLQAVPTSPPAVNLSWTDNAIDEDGYRVLRKTNNGPVELIAELPANTISYLDGDVQPCDTYTYVVRAFRFEGSCLLQSSDSNVATAVIPCNSQPVAQCTDLTLAAGSDCTASATPEEAGGGSYDPDGDPITLELFPPGPYPLGATPVQLLVMDAARASDTCTATITVVDATPPVLTCPADPSPISAEEDCRAALPDLTAEAVATDNCGTVTLSQEPVAGTRLDTGTHLVTLTATDAAGNKSSCQVAVSVVDDAPPALTIASPPSGAICQTGTVVAFAGTFVENCALASAAWRFQSNTSDTEVAGVIDTEAQSVSASHAFSSPGVYAVTLSAVDTAGNSATAATVGGVDGLPAFVVVYDPEAGFVTGGGWINSPAGAYAADPSLTGKASFGFVSRYKKGASVPDGNTEFQFRAGNLNFHSHSYEWLVIAGSRAQFKGDGTINGQGSYRFMITAIDGDLKDKSGSDKFRIRIWNDEGIVYDNQLNAPDSDDPTTVIGGGSIVIHK